MFQLRSVYLGVLALSATIGGCREEGGRDGCMAVIHSSAPDTIQVARTGGACVVNVYAAKSRPDSVGPRP